MLPRGWVYGAQYGLGNKGLGKLGLGERVVGWEEVSVKHLWVHIYCFRGKGGEREQHRGRADNQKVGGRRTREKIDEV